MGRWFSVLVFSLLCGCPGEIDPGPFYAARDGAIPSDGPAMSVCPPGIVNAQRDLLVPRCATAGCHNATDRQTGLDLESPGIVSRMLNQPAAAGPCAGRTLLTITNQGVQGVLLGKLPTPAVCGTRMPLGRMPMFLTPQETDCLTEFLLRESRLLPADGGLDAGTIDAAFVDVPNGMDAPNVMDVPNRDVPNAPRDVPNRDVPNVMDVPNAPRDVPNAMDVPSAMDGGNPMDVAG